MLENMRKCVNCGEYFTLTDDIPEELYCSDQCRAIYKRCDYCGEYFIVEKQDNESGEPVFCCDECRGSFEKNVLERKK